MTHIGEMNAKKIYEDVQNCPEIKKQYDPIHEFFMDALKIDELIETDSTNKRLHQDAQYKDWIRT